MADAHNNVSLGSYQLELDTSDLDVAQEKADRLKATLEAIKALQSEIVLGMPSGRSVDDIDPKFGVPVRR